MTIEGFIFWLLLIDSVSANFVSLSGNKWYVRHFRIISRIFPAAEGWAFYYFILVLWIGTLLFRANMLGI